jgi:hypothetical protein
MIVDDGNDLVALLMFVARVANPIAPFLATVLVPSPWSTLSNSNFGFPVDPRLLMEADYA